MYENKARFAIVFYLFFIPVLSLFTCTPQTPTKTPSGDPSNNIFLVENEYPVFADPGTSYTVANRAPSEYTYYNRGLLVTRSNTTVPMSPMKTV